MTEDPFAILKVPHDFDLTNAAIEAAYLRCIAAVHPDSAESGAADTEMARLNDARSILLKPESRANALLDSLGGPSAKACPELPPAYLLEILEQSMEIEEELASDPVAARPKWTAWANDERNKILAAVAPLFAQASPKEGKILRDLRTGLNAWRYIERLLERLDPGYDPNRNDFRD